MVNSHWSDDDLLDGLYGIKPPDEHLGACEECHRRWERLQLRREELCAPEIQVSQEFLARQRQAIYERLVLKPRWFNLQPAPVLATLLLFFVILTVFRSTPLKPPPASMSDAEVFEDIFNIASSIELSAVKPVQSLFEVQQ